MNVNGAGARPDINQLLTQMRGLRDQAQGAAVDQARIGQQQPLAGPSADVRGVQGAAPVAAAERPSFTDTLGRVLGEVNQTQLASGAAQTAFVKGERTDLVNVMVAAQKASVSFQAVTQVRNRLVEAYKDVMNMPI